MTPVDREVRKFCMVLKRRGLLFDVRQDPRGYSVQVLRYVELLGSIEVLKLNVFKCFSSF